MESVGESRISQEYAAFYKAIASKAKVPGFRPGKTPQDVLVMHFEKDASASVLERLISESLGKALREKEIHPLTSPKIDEIRFTKEKLC